MSDFEKDLPEDTKKWDPDSSESRFDDADAVESENPEAEDIAAELGLDGPEMTSDDSSMTSSEGSMEGELQDQLPGDAEGALGGEPVGDPQRGLEGDSTGDPADELMDEPLDVEEARPPAALMADDESLPEAEDADGNWLSSRMEADPGGGTTEFRDGPPPWRLGLIFSLCLVAVCGLSGYAVFFLLGGKLDQVFPPKPETLKILLGALGIMAGIGIVGVTFILRAASNATASARQARELLAAVAALDVDRREPWRQARFATHQGLSRCLLNIRNTLDRKQSELNRYLDLEGELLRLERALASGVRDDLAKGFEHPMAGSIADEVMQVYDASLQAQNERQALANRLDQNGASLCEKIEQASHWNCEAQDRLNCQTATLGNLVPRIQAWSPELRKSALVEEDRRQARETLDSLRRDLEALQARAGEQDLGGLAKGVKDLVARGGKLALRLAAETARAKEGEGSLLVVAEELQDLTTEFRAVATRMDDQSDYQKTIVQAVACIFDKISEFEAAAVAGEMPAADAWRELSQQVDEAQQEMQQTLAAMTDLPEGFNRQLEQLAEVGKKWAELTGAKFAPNQPKRSTTLARERPLSSTLRVQATRSASPPAGNVELDPAQAPAFEVETSKPARPSIFGTNESKPKPPEMLRPLPQPEDFDLAPANVKSQGGNPPLSSAEDRVYDLAEFGAVALSEGTPVDGTADDRIYDLTEFGAVALS